MKELLHVHFGLLTDDMQKSVKELICLGGKFIKTVIDEDRKVLLGFVEIENVLIEVIEPLDETSPVYNLLKKRGTHIYHLCLVVDEIEQKIKNLKGRYIVIEPPSPAKAFSGKKVAFLYSPSLGIVELLEK